MQYHEFHTDEGFDFEGGGHIDHLTVAYHTSPREYTPGEKVVWICHALTANSDAEDWWSEIVGPGKLIDTEKYYVVCSNMLGSPYGSSGPATINPATGKPYCLDFPKVSVRDIVRAHILVRKHLGIDRIHLLTGGSIGGFQVCEWTLMEPELINHSTLIATTYRISPWVTAQMEAQRMALEADQTFRECASLKGGEAGLKCARAQALITYRCFEGYQLRQSETDPDTLFADRAASYERYQGLKLANRFDAYSYWYLTYAVDSQNIGRGRGGVEKALESITVPCTIVGIDSDGMFPPQVQDVFAAHIPGAKHFQMHSEFGHDGFLLEYPQLTEILKPLL